MCVLLTKNCIFIAFLPRHLKWFRRSMRWKCRIHLRLPQNDTSNCKRFVLALCSPGVWNGLRCLSFITCRKTARVSCLKLGVRVRLVLTSSFLWRSLVYKQSYGREFCSKVVKFRVSALQSRHLMLRVLRFSHKSAYLSADVSKPTPLCAYSNVLALITDTIGCALKVPP